MLQFVFNLSPFCRLLSSNFYLFNCKSAFKCAAQFQLYFKHFAVANDWMLTDFDRPDFLNLRA